MSHHSETDPLAVAPHVGAGVHEAGAGVHEAGAGVHEAGADRILTVPNALSFLRLLGVPLFLWLLLGPEKDGWAFTVLALSAISDWADGKLARLLNQYSRLGAILDPAADRLYVIATLVAFVIRGFIPWWLAALIIGRDVILAIALPVMRRHGYPPFEVHYLGKAATFCLLYALPLLLLAQGDSSVAAVARPLALAFTGWGVLLYLWSAALYLRQAAWVIRNTPVVPIEARPTVKSVTGG
ncbi:CDP-alcohol phosphatidyltransferase family protein [Nakamurella antarctica]|uniref:CDP-alcohol phosphatidyltransferase family protein n=1 Tax=Nakamurella antarctica TaxID=1902245 RepID=A0A3G8ZLG8_9ACTN|nr:CDP-alcohol phosphatidyltransferase family protein [Nakamurella antarctica]AZI57627.1 CDP-alcohol phosphatidyltransferase family protein [Nakamurella antarctica]